jgi:hypothetical protein
MISVLGNSKKTYMKDMTGTKQQNHKQGNQKSARHVYYRCMIPCETKLLTPFYVPLI